jgi:hypothetical protein
MEKKTFGSQNSPIRLGTVRHMQNIQRPSDASCGSKESGASGNISNGRESESFARSTSHVRFEWAPWRLTHSQADPTRCIQFWPDATHFRIKNFVRNCTECGKSVQFQPILPSVKIRKPSGYEHVGGSIPTRASNIFFHHENPSADLFLFLACYSRFCPNRLTRKRSHSSRQPL